MIAIVDYGAGNLTSVVRSVRHIGKSCEVTRDPKVIEQADCIIFPGVGAAGSAMKSLRAYGLDESIRIAFRRGIPILGICLGTQVILSHSEEGDTACIGLLPGNVIKFKWSSESMGVNACKIPHMGWNRVRVVTEHPVLKDIEPDDEFYFVHSFYPSPRDERHVLAETEYGIDFVSVIGEKNLVATQFHPEKSGRPGLALLSNFCSWVPSC